MGGTVDLGVHNGLAVRDDQTILLLPKHKGSVWEGWGHQWRVRSIGLPPGGKRVRVELHRRLSGYNPNKHVEGRVGQGIAGKGSRGWGWRREGRAYH